ESDSGLICPECMGSGETLNFEGTEWEHCNDCDGTGRLEGPETEPHLSQGTLFDQIPCSIASLPSSTDNLPRPPEPEYYAEFENFKADYDAWLEKLWASDDDIAQTEESFTNAEELWEQRQKLSPFSNSTEYFFWTRSNCYECDKNRPDECEISDALLLAGVGNGLITKSIFNRMGCRSGKCTEFVPQQNKSQWVGGLFVGASSNV
ncbi:MAG TPA: hypothetical protein VFM18_15525, partial [Methanosarcina sp.]|nr:hypothetical protein [Methanosarcina sp.]